jgi:glycine/D-amino acid oxidase-like deaminating enzyme
MASLSDGGASLRSGVSLWQALDKDGPDPRDVRPRAGEVLSADICIIGAGITGAFLAERMTRLGKSVIVIDRREPQKGSTAASTAMLLWELDAPLLEIEDRLGFDAAKAISAECRRAVADIAGLAQELGVDCSFRPRTSVYLSGTTLDPVGLREELELRRKLEAPSYFRDAGQLERMGFRGEAALISPGSAEANPVALARGLLGVARGRGARVLSPVTALGCDSTARGVEIETSVGAMVKAGALVLANGYEMPDFVPAASHTVLTSWALSAKTPAGVECEALVWEASDPYLYFRAGPGGRVVVGGEDEETTDPQVREALAPAKIARILERVGQLMPALKGIEPDYSWSGLFGETEDSLPMIGPVPGRPHCFAAFGYGGNGITFSAIAAAHLEEAIAGRRAGTSAFYAPGRT